MSDTRPLTPEELDVFRRRAYTLENCGTYYLRCLIDACGRDMEEGRKLRAELEAERHYVARKFTKAVREGKTPNFSIDPNNPAMAYDPMPLDSKSGEQMRFTGHGGYQHDQDHARKFLTVDGIYTVKSVEVREWSSSVEFKEFPGKSFNTVMFEAAPTIG